MENIKSTKRFPFRGISNQNLAKVRMKHPTTRATPIYGRVFPIIISGYLSGDIKIRSIEPDSFSFETLTHLDFWSVTVAEYIPLYVLIVSLFLFVGNKLI